MGTVKDPEREENYAFECREFVRRLLIGKEVQFKVEYKTPGNRDVGSLRIHPSMAVDGENDVARIIVKNGWARVKQPEGGREPSEEQTLLMELEKSAQTDGKGLWSSSPYTVSFSWPNLIRFRRNGLSGIRLRPTRGNFLIFGKAGNLQVRTPSFLIENRNH